MTTGQTLPLGGMTVPRMLPLESNVATTEMSPQNTGNKTRQVLHVDMDAFFASVEQQTFPFLRGRPVGVCGDPHGRTVIAAASYEAKRRGVKTAMTIPEARRVCPEIILVAGNPAKYIDTSVRMLAIYTRFSDLVEVFSIDEAFIDVTRTAHLFGGAEAIAQEIKRQLRRHFGLTCSIGIAPNRLLAKLAGEMDKPDGLMTVRPEDVPGLLERTLIQSLCGIGPKTTAKLNRLGIRTCADLGRYPERELFRLFGINGIHLHQMGNGVDESPVLPYFHEPETKSMGHSLTLCKDTRDIAVVRRHLLQLSERVGRRLRQDGYAGRTVSVVLRYADFTTVVRQRSLKSYTNDGPRIYRVGLRIFEELYRNRRFIRLLGISVSSLVQNLGQRMLFDNRRSATLLQAADRLNDRFGEFTVNRARLAEPAPKMTVIAPSWRPARKLVPSN